jgi:sulfite reductase (ferredoxin)
LEKIKCNSAKQAGYVAIGIKVQLGDFIPIKLRISAFDQNYAANELRFTLRQDILIRHVKENLSFTKNWPNSIL